MQLPSLQTVKEVAIREFAHAGGGAVAVYGLSHLVGFYPVLAAVLIAIAVAVYEYSDVSHGRDPLWKGILDGVAWAVGLYIGVVASFKF